MSDVDPWMDKTGNQITPEAITAKFIAQGILPDPNKSEKQDSSAVPKDATVSEKEASDESEGVQEVTESVTLSEQDPQEKEPAQSEIELKARALGWDPKKGNKTAEEFMETQPLYSEITRSHKEIKELREQISQVVAYVKKQNATELQKSLEDLKNARKAAIKAGNVEQVDQLDAAIAKKVSGAKETELTTPLEHPEVASFKSRNASWVSATDSEAKAMIAYAVEQDKVISGLEPREHLAEVERRLRAKFPTRMPEVGSTKQAIVNSDSGRSMNKAVKKGPTYEDLNAEQKRTAAHFAKIKLMTVDEYIKTLVKSGEL